MFVPNFKILDAVVPEKSLTKKKFTHRQTHTDQHCYGKGENYIPPHTSCAGCIISISKEKLSEVKCGLTTYAHSMSMI